MAVLCIDSLTPIKVARHYDGAADVIEFDVGRWIEAYPALTEYRVEVTSPGGVVYFPEAVDLDGHMLKWTIMPGDTGVAGNGEYQIVATGLNGERKTSASARFVVREIMDGAASETPPDPAQPWVDKVVEAAQKVEDATVHPPIIGENGNWWLWDFEASAYVDSGKPSQGSGSGGGGITQESDPTVPAWAKQPNPPTYTAQDVGARPADWLPTPDEIGAQPAGNYALKSEIPAVPVKSVNGKAGDVKLNAEDVGAASSDDVARLSEEIGDKQPKGDYALKSEIPAPYTLPTASDTVKGGVKVGEGLSINSDGVLSKTSEKLTLKETKTIEVEGVSSYISYKGYKQFMVEILTPAIDAGYLLTALLGSSSKPIKTWARRYCNTSATSTRIYVWPQAGIWRTLVETSLTSSVSEVSVQGTAGRVWTIDDYEYCFYINLIPSNPNGFPVGTVINVYGVSV